MCSDVTTTLRLTTTHTTCCSCAQGSPWLLSSCPEEHVGAEGRNDVVEERPVWVQGDRFGLPAVNASEYLLIGVAL